MEWFWDAYASDPTVRSNILLSPLNASIAKLTDLPEALIITDKYDVLRDEGELYADKLTQANVQVTSIRIRHIIHDFMMLDPLANTTAAKSATLIVINCCNIL